MGLHSPKIRRQSGGAGSWPDGKAGMPLRLGVIGACTLAWPS